MHLYQQKTKLRNYLKDKYFSTEICLLNLGRMQSQLNKFLYTLIAYFLQETTLQKNHMYSTLKRRGNGCFQVEKCIPSGIHPCRFNVECPWCVYRVSCSVVRTSKGIPSEVFTCRWCSARCS